MLVEGQFYFLPFFCTQIIFRTCLMGFYPAAYQMNEIGKLLGQCLDEEQSSGRPVKLVRSRVAAKAVRLLFKELIKGIKY